MFIKTHLNWTNLVSEASCLGRLNPCVKHGSIRFVAILNEWGITPIRRDKKKSLAAQIRKNIAHIQYSNVFRAQNQRRWGLSIRQNDGGFSMYLFKYAIIATMKKELSYIVNFHIRINVTFNQRYLYVNWISKILVLGIL